MKKLNTVELAVIGGTGLYDIEGLTAIEEINVNTPYGPPSDSIITGTLEGVRVAFLPRHGRGHRIMPTEIPVRANIWALKSLGVKRIIAINSVGSFKKEVAPGHLLIPDQLLDRTSRRINTFFGEGVTAHIGFAEPFCPEMRNILVESGRQAGATVHKNGTYLVMEGPAFSTRAESRLHKSWGVDVIGMTALPEAKLAREAEICYGIIACSTDYDAWHEEETPVTVDMIIATLKANMEISKQIIKLAVGRLPIDQKCSCPNALAGAIVTDPKLITPERREQLDLIAGKYLDS